MRDTLHKMLCCPTCGADLKLTIWEEDGEHVMEGVFVCEQDAGHWFPVREGIPRILAPEYRHEDQADITWGRLHVEDLITAGAAPNSVPSDDELLALQQHTIRSFGYEWQVYDRFGWDDTTYDLDYSMAAFHKKAIISGQFLCDYIFVETFINVVLVFHC